MYGAHFTARNNELDVEGFKIGATELENDF